jgi:hypothetical protein
LGHELFKSSSESFPVLFVAGDVFDPSYLEICPPFLDPPDTPAPNLPSLASLNPLHGHASAIHASAFFHLFDEDQQLQLAKALAGLLSPSPGSIIFGEHFALAQKGLKDVLGREGVQIFCHSPESWKELWDGEVFSKGSVEVKAVLRVYDSPTGKTVERLIWSISKL